MKKLIHVLIGLLKSLWQIIKTINFWTALLATMIGVLLAFNLNSQWQKSHLNKITAQKLHLVFLESQFNGTTAHEVFKVYSKSSVNTVIIKRTDVSLAFAAIQDENIITFLPAYKLSLLISYIDAQKTLNYSLENYENYLFGKKQILQNKEVLINNIKGNAASALTMCLILQKEMKIYFNKHIYEHDKILSLEQNIKKTKQSIRQGTIKVKTEK